MGLFSADWPTALFEDDNMSDNKNVFTYVGDPSDDLSGPNTLEVYGLTFTKGKAVTVDDEKVAAKLRGHSHFVNGDEEVETQTRIQDDLVGLNVDELKAIAENEDVDLTGKTRKGDILEAIREAREAKENDQ